jgi:hypothetical protein
VRAEEDGNDDELRWPELGKMVDSVNCGLEVSISSVEMKHKSTAELVVDSLELGAASIDGTAAIET